MSPERGNLWGRLTLETKFRKRASESSRGRHQASLCERLLCCDLEAFDLMSANSRKQPMSSYQLYPDFLKDPTQYGKSEDAWRALWHSVDSLKREADGWESPWVDGSWKDGNPIFSAWSPKRRVGLRIIQHDNPQSGITVWRNTFGERGTSDAVDELVISCALTETNRLKVQQLMQRLLCCDPEGVLSRG